jgi:hypothetical protein
MESGEASLVSWGFSASVPLTDLARAHAISRFSQDYPHRGCESANVVVPQRLLQRFKEAPMQTECSPDWFDFGVVEGRAVGAAFDAGTRTPDMISHA